MTKDDIQLLFEYDRWANNRVLQAASSLTAEQFTRDLSGSFRSVRDTLVHIIGGEWGWLTYWKEPSPNSAFSTRRPIQPECFSRRDCAAAEVGGGRERTGRVRESVDQRISEKLLPVRTTQISLAHLMQHLANHSTYHRGQVALMLRQLDAEPLATDFHVFLLQRARERQLRD